MEKCTTTSPPPNFGINPRENNTIFINLDSILSCEAGSVVQFRYRTVMERLTYTSNLNYDVIFYILTTSNLEVSKAREFIKRELEVRGWRHKMPKYQHVARQNFFNMLEYHLLGEKLGILIDGGVEEGGKTDIMLRSIEMDLVANKLPIACFTASSYFM